MLYNSCSEYPRVESDLYSLLNEIFVKITAKTYNTIVKSGVTHIIFLKLSIFKDIYRY